MQNGPTYQFFTAAQIAAALKVSKRSVLNWLEKSRADSVALVKGQEAKAWSFQNMPQKLQDSLTVEATRQGHRTALDLLNAPVKRWEAPIPLAAVSEPYLKKAVKLREALAPALEKNNDLSLNEAEFRALGVMHYRRTFGFAISERHWFELFKRTLIRDNGLEEWHRLELYLDEAAFRTAQRPAIPSDGFDHSALAAQIQLAGDPLQLTLEKREFVWDAAIRHYESLRAAHTAAGALKKSVLHFLADAVPGLAKSLESLRRVFDTKLSTARTIDTNSPLLRDGRALKSGFHRTPDFSQDHETLIALAVQHGGNIALAHRLARKNGLLSAEFESYYSFDPRSNKSRVPNRVLKQIRSAVIAASAIHRGPKHVRDTGPYISRDWSGVEPGDWFCADDVTWNHYVWDIGPDGKPYIFRPECLVFNCPRTSYILDFEMIDGRYTGRHIRRLITRVHDKVGLPRKGLYFERGTWASRLIDGEKRKTGEECDWTEIELGLREQGLDLQVRHARGPRAKPIEGDFRILQERMRSEPGFCGFDERRLKQEALQDFKLQVERGNEHPGKFLISFEQWASRLAELFGEFNRDPQNGKRLNGRTPEEAWIESMDRMPLRKLPSEARYILATHRIPTKITAAGIRIQKALYWSEATSRMVGQKVLAYYNLEYPEVLTFSDLDRQNFFTATETKLPAMDATAEDFAATRAKLKKHRAFGKTVYANIRHKMLCTVTHDRLYDELTKDLGRSINESVEAHKAEKRQMASQVSRAEKLSAEIGVGVPVAARTDASCAEQAVRLMEILKTANEEQT